MEIGTQLAAVHDFFGDSDLFFELLVGVGMVRIDHAGRILQIRITKEVMHSRKLSPDLHKLVKGVMIESYIEEGNQKVGAGCYGKSITDPCLGWEDSERLIYDIAEYE